MFVALVACGNDRAPTSLVDAPPDTSILPDTPTPPAGCDWAELDDALNDLTLANGAAEPTNLTFDQSLIVCGRVDPGHFADPVVDIDSFAFTIATRAELRVDFAGAAATLAGLEVRVIDGSGAIVDRGRFLGSHIAFHTALGPGGYRLVVIASNPVEPAAAIDYKLRVSLPVPCERVTRAADFMETDDGAQSDRNDVVEIRYAPDERALTAAANDAPESSGVITAAGTDVLLAGTSADVDSADDFRDRDSFLIETGAHDELALRVDWTGDADLDVFVFPENAIAELASGTAVGKTGPERVVTPVLPNTRYWLWVGAYDSSSGANDYEISLCPSSFTPP
jgi:hypothetical protein